MSFDSLEAFLAMGGHGFYVWTVYLTTLALLIANFANLRRAWRRTLRELRALHGASEPASGPPSVPSP